MSIGQQHESKSMASSDDVYFTLVTDTAFKQLTIFLFKVAPFLEGQEAKMKSQKLSSLY